MRRRLQVVVGAQHDIEAKRAEERAGVVDDVSCGHALASLPTAACVPSVRRPPQRARLSAASARAVSGTDDALLL